MLRRVTLDFKLKTLNSELVSSFHRNHSMEIRNDTAAVQGASTRDASRKAPSSDMMRAGPQARRACFYRTRAKYQYRDIQGQYQQRNQHAAAAQSQASALRRWRRSGLKPGFPATGRRSAPPAHRPASHTGCPARAPSAPAARRLPASGPAPCPAPAWAAIEARAAFARACRPDGRWRTSVPATASRPAARPPIPHPGAMVRSMLISGPTPRGKRLTTIMKKNSVVRTSDRRRIASRRSR